MEDGVAIQSRFMDFEHSDLLYEQAELLDYDGRFEEIF